MKTFVCAALLLLGASAALADTRREREEVMALNTHALRLLQPLVSDFDAAAAQAQAQVLADNGAKIAALFAPGTDRNDPHALQTVWSNAAGFKAAAGKFTADARKVAAATDGASLQTALQVVQADCAACHRTYRPSMVPPTTMLGQ